ncbi:MAG: hypothetical protein NC394_02380 [Bacteroides sp.]|nr:hypothetical protein [Bacteroides sp.]
MAKEKGGKKALAPKIEEEALKLAKPLVEKAGCTLWDVCFEKEGAMWYLRVLFDSESGVDSDRCEEISKPIDRLFDKQSFIEQVDILEIGTPGVYRKLRKPEHFNAALGQRVSAQIKTDGAESYKTGILEAYSKEEGLIVIDGESIRLSKCVKVNLEPEELTELEEYGEEEYGSACGDTDGCADEDENEDGGEE